MPYDSGIAANRTMGRHIRRAETRRASRRRVPAASELSARSRSALDSSSRFLQANALSATETAALLFA